MGLRPSEWKRPGQLAPKPLWSMGRIEMSRRVSLLPLAVHSPGNSPGASGPHTCGGTHRGQPFSRTLLPSAPSHLLSRGTAAFPPEAVPQGYTDVEPGCRGNLKAEFDEPGQHPT